MRIKLVVFIFLVNLGCFFAQSKHLASSDSIDTQIQFLILNLNRSWDGDSLGAYITKHSLTNSVHQRVNAILLKLKSFEEQHVLLSVTADLLTREANYKAAQDLYFEIIKICDRQKRKKPKFYANLSLGIMYNEIKMSSEAIAFYQAAELHKNVGIPKEHLIPLYTNWADCYYEMATYDARYYDSAMVKCNKALQVLGQDTDLNFEQGIYQTLGLIQTDKENYKDAEKSLKRSLILSQRMNDSSYVSYGYYQLGRMYANSHGYFSPDSALHYLKKSYNINLCLKDVGLMVEIYYSMAMAYKQKGDYKKSTDVILRYADLNDSFALQNNNAMIAELNRKYETAKKEAQITDLNLQKKESQAQLDKQNYIIIGGVFVLMMVLIIVFVLIRSNKAKRIANEIISEQKHVVEHKNHIIEEKQKEIIDSINYAKRIQYTLLAHADFLTENLPEHFVYFHPKDIVSGDFYWAAKRQNKFYLAVCDSTGHGVPGAFMSLLNIGFLTEAINEKGIEEPGEVLDYVRERLITNISKEGQQDGFDGILICMDTGSDEIRYAAANNAPLLVRDGKYSELASDRMPVGIGERKECFKTYVVEKQAGDLVFLYTDGYADQFGGPKGKKFKYKALNELLLQHAQKHPSAQKAILSEEFEKWRGSLEQIDDVCVIGIRL